MVALCGPFLCGLILLADLPKARLHPLREITDLANYHASLLARLLRLPPYVRNTAIKLALNQEQGTK